MWFGETADPRALFLFSQHGYVPVMQPQKQKTADRGERVEHLRRDGEWIILVETEKQEMKRYRRSEFRPYYSKKDPAHVVMPEVNIAVAINKAERHKAQIPKTSDKRTAAPASTAQAAKYPDNMVWAWAIDSELDEIDGRRMIKWLPPSTKITSKPTPMTMSVG